jgi:hypothetical protein
MIEVPLSLLLGALLFALALGAFLMAWASRDWATANRNKNIIVAQKHKSNWRQPEDWPMDGCAGLTVDTRPKAVGGDTLAEIERQPDLNDTLVQIERREEAEQERLDHLMDDEDTYDN